MRTPKNCAKAIVLESWGELAEKETYTSLVSVYSNMMHVTKELKREQMRQVE